MYSATESVVGKRTLCSAVEKKYGSRVDGTRIERVRPSYYDIPRAVVNIEEVGLGPLLRYLGGIVFCDALEMST